jgi:hypothetical protein
VLVRLVPGLVLAVAATSVLAGCGGADPQPRAEQPGAPSPTAGSSKATEAAPDPESGAPEPGTCFRMTPAQSRASVSGAPKVSCKKPHTSVVAHVEFLKKAVTPRTPVAKLRSLGLRLCAPAYRRLAGGTVADRASSLTTWTLFTPGRAALERGARWVRCDVLARSGDRLVPLPATRPLLAQGVPEPLRVCQDEQGLDVSCSDPHRFRVAAVFRAVGEDYPRGEAFTAQARDRCRELTGKFGGFWQPPSEDGWRAGDRFVRCLELAG